MSTLNYSILSITTDGLFIDEEILVKDIQPEHTDAIPIESFMVSGDFTRMDDEFLFHGYLRGAFLHPCARCLELARSEFEVEVYWYFEEGPEALPFASNTEDTEEIQLQDDEPPEYRTYQNGIINLAPHLWEELCFTLPLKFLCAEDCKGLCPVCGANLNRSSCNCAEHAVGDADETPAAFAKLAEMFPDLPKDNSGN